MKKLVLSILVLSLGLGGVYAQTLPLLPTEAKTEIRAYATENIVPVLQTEQANFDATLSQEDLALLETYREQATDMKAAHRATFEQIKAAKEEGATREELREEYKSQLQEMRTARRELMAQVKPLIKANRAALRSTMLEVRTHSEEWRTAIREIATDYLSEEKLAQFDEMKEQHNVLFPILGMHNMKHSTHHQGEPQHKRHIRHRLQKMAAMFVLWDGATPNMLESTAQELPVQSLHASSFPNPAKEEVTISFDLPSAANQVTIQLVSQRGKVVKEQTLRDVQQGLQSTTWNVNTLEKGVYYYTIIADKHRETKQLIVE